MKKIYVLCALTALLFTGSCSQSTHKAAGKANSAMIEFVTTEHNFGSIPEGGDGTYGFAFKSTGKEPLILNNVRSSCGCTIPEWPREPIKKGEQGVIKVKYNTHVTGNFTKSITVYSNAGEEPIVLVIKGKVEAAAKNE